MPRSARKQAITRRSGLLVALFERIDRPQLHAKTLNLDELIEMLTRFEVLNDKHHGRCWSPTKYAHGATTRGNDGVESVNCLVFDCDRVPPDPHRLEHVCWIGHTTHSHTPQAPRWRVVIPLARPVSAKRWAEVWRRARAALCPEADPACKDCSRAYWLPSRPASVAPETSYHPGPLLDPRTLPETGSHGDPGVAMGSLPPEQRTIARMSTKNARRAPTATDQRGEAYMAQVLDNLAGVASGSRNIALNKAAWKLGQWVAAGALDQARVEDALFAAAKRNGLVSDPKDGPRKTWATIRSGLSAGLQEPTRLDDKTRSRRQRSP